MAPTEDCPVAREVTVRPETDSPLATALLDEIRSLDAGRPGPSVLDLAIESYGKETRTLCEQLGEVVRLGDVRQVAELAHSIKSASAQLGVTRVAEQAAAIEHAARGGALAGVDASLDALAAEVERGCAALRAYAAAGSAATGVGER
ncbi:MAG TPA: Hpt domain-containing protein [Myxococcota bacterium]|nr:Hpt domain-containing protein [Myxococcota bacterium]